MRIISWNVNGIRANTKKGGFDWLINESPDMFCLQETKAHPDQLEPNIVSPSLYTSYFDHSKGRKGYSGVAIYTKQKPEKVEYGFGIEELDQEGRQIALFYKDFVLVNTYFPNGGGGPERLDFKMRYYSAFLKYIEKIRKNGLEVIFCGDINTAHNEIDLARPKENEKNTGFLPTERAWLDEVVSKGYVDTWRNLNPKKIQYSWWDMKTFARERNVGWRIDYFFASEKIAKKITKAKIHDSILGSDHCPIEIIVS
jgi:exodeoxyribonuclease III